MPQETRKNLPKALRREVWVTYNCGIFDAKCAVKWCHNTITPFDFEVGHNIPFSKGGTDTIDNLKPICSLCNKSMSDNYTIDEFSDKFMTRGKQKTRWWMCFTA